MCVYDGERRRYVYGEVRVEADGMYVEEWDESLVCVGGEFGEELWSDWCGCDDESVRLEDIRLGEPRLYWLQCVSIVCTLPQADLHLCDVVGLQIWIELLEQFTRLLGTETTQVLLLEEEVDAQICFIY